MMVVVVISSECGSIVDQVQINVLSHAPQYQCHIWVLHMNVGRQSCLHAEASPLKERAEAEAKAHLSSRPKDQLHRLQVH